MIPNRGYITNIIAISLLFFCYSDCYSQDLSNVDMQSPQIQQYLNSSPEVQNKLIQNYNKENSAVKPVELRNLENDKEKFKKKVPNSVNINRVNNDSSIEIMMNKNHQTPQLNLPPYHFKDPQTTYKPTSELENLTNKVNLFGYDIFNKPISKILDMNIPVNDDYILGVDDTLVVRLWGKIEQRFEVSIDKNGSIYLPKVGHINLLGASFKEAKLIIKRELDRMYVNYDLSLTMGQLKTIKIFILGEVENPGAYDISSLSTLFTALHAAGGPTKKGTLRNVKLKRNSKTIANIDLYNYLLKGDNSNDPKLKNYDTIFVPPIGPVVKIYGSVKRPAIYELNNRETLYDGIFNLSGGPIGTSDISNVKLSRIHNNEYIKLYDINTSMDKATDIFKQERLTSNDLIFVSKILNIKKNTVKITGMVFRSGEYSWKPGMTLQSLFDQAKGLKPGYDNQQINIFRYVSDTQRKIIVFDPKQDSFEKFILEDWDIIAVKPVPDFTYSIEGNVFFPGYYKLLEDMTLADALHLAKPKPDSTNSIHIVRTNFMGKPQIITTNYNIIKNNFNHPKNIKLKLLDQIFIKHNPRLSEKQFIYLSGEFNIPGKYFFNDGETIYDVIKRAGGFKHTAFFSGLRITRSEIKGKQEDGIANFIQAEEKRLTLENDDTKQAQLKFLKNQTFINTGRLAIEGIDELKEIECQANDHISIPKSPYSISVVGGVISPIAVKFISEKSPNYYIKQVGGRTKYTKRKDVYVFKASGIIIHNPKRIEQGDVIYLPEYPDNKYFKDFLKSFNTNLRTVINMLTTVFLIQNLTE